jgi:hypothetical protein
VEGCGSSEVRDVVSGIFGRAPVWSDVDPHGGGLDHTDGGAIVIEVLASTLFVCLGGWVEDDMRVK